MRCAVCGEAAGKHGCTYLCPHHGILLMGSPEGRRWTNASVLPAAWMTALADFARRVQAEERADRERVRGAT